MSTSIGPRIGIDGYSQYKAEIKSLIAQMDTYRAKCEGLSNSAEDLKEKERLLTEQIKLQEQVVQKYKEMQTKAQKQLEASTNATEKNEGAINRNKTSVINANTALTQAENSLKRLQNEYNNLGQAAEDSGGKVDAQAVALGNVMAKLAEKAAEALKDIVETGLNYNASIETTQAAFETLLGSAEAAAEAVSLVKQMSKNVPTFDTSTLMKATQMIIATGQDAKSATEDVYALANAVAASGGGNSELERMAQNLQQIGNNGKASAIDIKQFNNAGINVWGLLLDYTGKTKEELSETVITYEMLTGALKLAAEEGGRYYGGLEKQAGTYNGQISALKKNFEELSGSFVSGITQVAESDILPFINDFLQTDKVREFAEAVGELSPVIATLTGALSAAAAANKLFQASFDMGLLGAVAAGVLMIAEAWREATNWEENAVLGEGKTLEEYEANVEKYRKEIEELKKQEKDLALYGGDLTLVQNDLSKATIQLAAAEKELETATKAASEATEEAAKGTPPEARYEAIVANARESLDALKESYNGYYEAAAKAAEKEFDLFELVEKLDYTSTQKLKEGLESQTAYWEQYTRNLEYVSDAQAGLSDELLAFLSDGSQESAGYLQSIVQDIMSAGGATSEKGQAIINELNQKFSELQTAQSAYATATAMTLSEYEAEMNGIVDSAKEKLKELELSEEMYAAGVSSIEGYAAGIAQQMPGFESAMFVYGQNLSIQIQNGINSIPISLPSFTGFQETGLVGTYVEGSHAKGLDYVPHDEYIASLHKGEMVLTAAQANAVRSGAYQQSVRNQAYNYGGVSINVYAAEGQSADDIAETVAFKLQHDVSRKEEVYK